MVRLFSQPDLHAVYLPHVQVKMRVGGASNRAVDNILRKSREDICMPCGPTGSVWPGDFGLEESRKIEAVFCEEFRGLLNRAINHNGSSVGRPV